MGNNLKIELFRQKIIHSIRNSGLDIGIVRPIIKEIYIDLEEEYQVILMKEAKEESKEKGDKADGSHEQKET